MARNSTKTRDFGVSKREGHDSSPFYSSRIYDGIIINDKIEIIDRSSELSTELFNTKSILNEKCLNNILKNSIHLIVVQIPTIKKEAIELFNKWREEMTNLVKRLKELLVTGGRLILIVENQLNISNNASQYYPVHSKITNILINENMIMRGNIILHSASVKDKINEDTLNSNYKIALISCKDSLKRIKKNMKSKIEKSDSITRDQFLSYTKSIWRFEPNLILNLDGNLIQSQEKYDYIQRFIQLYSFVEDNILYILPKIDDSFMKIALNNRKKNLFLEW